MYILGEFDHRMDMPQCAGRDRSRSVRISSSRTEEEYARMEFRRGCTTTFAGRSSKDAESSECT